jgi:hypothetical protein
MLFANREPSLERLGYFQMTMPAAIFRNGAASSFRAKQTAII